MFIINQLAKLRRNDGDEEKPFLDHLEDLRKMFFRIIITLAVATVGAYVFRLELMEIIRKPIEDVWEMQQRADLPEEITPAQWELAKKSANRAIGLSPEQKKHFYDQFDDKTVSDYAQCATYYRLALLLEDKTKRVDFVKNMPGLDGKKRAIIVNLLEKHPNAKLDAKESMVYMRSLRPTETFMLAIKLALYAGLILSFPIVLFFILQFVLPALKQKEKKATWWALLIGFLLFLTGVVFCYYQVLPRTLEFFFSFGTEFGVQNEWQIGQYISFATQFTLIFGLGFELPVLVMALVKIGLLNYEMMRNTRSYAAVGIVFIAAVITPTGDALTLSLLAVPMYVLYEICIWLSYFDYRKQAKEELAEMREMSGGHAGSDADSSAVAAPVPAGGIASIELEETDLGEEDDGEVEEDLLIDEDAEMLAKGQDVKQARSGEEEKA